MAKEKEVAVDVVQVINEKVTGMRNMLETTKVEKESDLTVASDLIKKVKQLGKFIEQEKDKFVAPAKAIIAVAKTKYDPAIKECDNAEVILKGRVRVFMDEQDRVRRESEAAIAKKLEDGRIKPETAVKKFEALPEAPKTVIADNSGIRRSMKKVAKIVDASLIPDEYWVLDEVKVRKVALAGVAIPGVVVEEESVISSI